MAEYCTNCASKLNIPIDIDVRAISKKLKRGEAIHVEICEGCSLSALAKNERNVLLYGVLKNKEYDWQEYNLIRYLNFPPSKDNHLWLFD